MRVEIVLARFADASLQEKMEWLACELGTNHVGIEELSEKTGLPIPEVDKILNIMWRDEVVFQDSNGVWRRTT